MELVFVAAVVVSFIACTVYPYVRDVVRRRLAARRERINQARARLQQQQRIRAEQIRHKQLDQQLQIAFLQLERAPDFRRVASWAMHAAVIAPRHRQRLFTKFRPRLVDHFTARLTAGTEEQVLYDSLCDLLVHLSVSPFEADYIRQEAIARRPRTEARQPSFGDVLTRNHRQHQERMDSIRRLEGLDDETRERLIEAENTRYRHELLSGNDETAAPQW